MQVTPTWAQLRAYMLANCYSSATAQTPRQILAGMGYPHGAYLSGELRRRMERKEPGLHEDRRLGTRGAYVWWIVPDAAEAQAQAQAQAAAAPAEHVQLNALTPVFGAIFAERLGQPFNKFDATRAMFQFQAAGPWQAPLEVLRRYINKPEAHLNLSVRHDNGNPLDELTHAISLRLHFLATISHSSNGQPTACALFYLPALVPWLKELASRARRERLQLRGGIHRRRSACRRAVALGGHGTPGAARSVRPCTAEHRARCGGTGMNTEGTRTGRLSIQEPNIAHRPGALEALQGAVERLQRAGAGVLGVFHQTTLRAALEARSEADKEGLRKRLDYRHLEERVLANMLDPEFAPVDPEAFKGLPAAMYGPAGPLPRACPWDEWKPGRDVA